MRVAPAAGWHLPRAAGVCHSTVAASAIKACAGWQSAHCGRRYVVCAVRVLSWARAPLPLPSHMGCQSRLCTCWCRNHHPSFAPYLTTHQPQTCGPAPAQNNREQARAQFLTRNDPAGNVTGNGKPAEEESKPQVRPAAAPGWAGLGAGQVVAASQLVFWRLSGQGRWHGGSCCAGAAPKQCAVNARPRPPAPRQLCARHNRPAAAAAVGLGVGLKPEAPPPTP